MPNQGTLSQQEQQERSTNLQANRADKKRAERLDRERRDEEKSHLKALIPGIASDLIKQARVVYIAGNNFPVVESVIADPDDSGMCAYLRRQLKKAIRKEGIRRFSLEIVTEEDEDGISTHAELTIHRMKTA